jgi:hypothetical protein
MVTKPKTKPNKAGAGTKFPTGKDIQKIATVDFEAEKRDPVVLANMNIDEQHLMVARMAVAAMHLSKARLVEGWRSGGGF